MVPLMVPHGVTSLATRPRDGGCDEWRELVTPYD